MNIAYHELMNDSRLMIDPNKDVNEVCAFILAGKKNGCVILGGGSPKNFYLQGQPTLWEVYGIPKGGNDYFIQITTDSGRLGRTVRRDAGGSGELGQGESGCASRHGGRLRRFDDRIPAVLRVRRRLAQRPPASQGTGAQARRARRGAEAAGQGGIRRLVGTLASELGGHAQQLSGQPRVYVDANVPAGLVAFMRTSLAWDVLFVIEHDDLRRARDGEHYRLARQLRRTLITLDRDYLDDRKFPPERSGGVVVLMAPTQGGFIHLLKRLDREVLRAATAPWPEHAGRTAAARGPQASRARRLGRPVIVLSKGDVVLPDRVLSEGTIVIDARTHRRHRARRRRSGAGRRPSMPATATSCLDSSTSTCTASRDTTRWTAAMRSREIASRLPRYGVTAFCPTTVACPPEELRTFLNQVRDARVAAVPGRARVLPAHLESNFISPDYRGAQPASCLRAAGRERAVRATSRRATSSTRSPHRGPTSAS